MRYYFDNIIKIEDFEFESFILKIVGKYFDL